LYADLYDIGMQAGAPAGARRAPASPRMQKLPSLQEPAGVLTDLCVILPGYAAQGKQSCRCLPESASEIHSFTAWRRGPSWGPRAAAKKKPLETSSTSLPSSPEHLAPDPKWQQWQGMLPVRRGIAAGVNDGPAGRAALDCSS
jgi:hypothetical protein